MAGAARSPHFVGRAPKNEKVVHQSRSRWNQPQKDTMLDPLLEHRWAFWAEDIESKHYGWEELLILCMSSIRAAIDRLLWPPGVLSSLIKNEAILNRTASHIVWYLHFDWAAQGLCKSLSEEIFLLLMVGRRELVLLWNSTAWKAS